MSAKSETKTPVTVGSAALFAVIVESSDDAGDTWEIHGIAWTVGEAAMLAREIPWTWRLRKVSLSDDGLIGWEETQSALAAMEKLESIFTANANVVASAAPDARPD